MGYQKLMRCNDPHMHSPSCPRHHTHNTQLKYAKASRELAFSVEAEKAGAEAREALAEEMRELSGTCRCGVCTYDCVLVRLWCGLVMVCSMFPFAAILCASAYKVVHTRSRFAHIYLRTGRASAGSRRLPTRRAAAPSGCTAPSRRLRRLRPTSRWLRSTRRCARSTGGERGGVTGGGGQLCYALVGPLEAYQSKELLATPSCTKEQHTLQ